MSDFVISTKGISEFSDKLKKLLEGKTRPVAQAGAQVVYEQVLDNVSRINSVTGNLKNSIYQAFSEDRSSGSRSTYAVSYRTGYNSKSRTGGLTIAPHGHLLEYGWVQRYEVYVNKKGEFKTKIRPENYGKPLPKRRASQAEKDAFFVPRKGGPIARPPQPFMGPAIDQARERAIQAMKDKANEIVAQSLKESV
jgi:hypothetical protein